MKVILYMATTANGYVAKLDHDTPWTETEFESYSSKVKELGNLIIGKTTFDLMHEEDAFVELGEPLVVVLTSSKEKPPRTNTVYVGSFTEAIQVLKKNGFTIALVSGGGQTDTAALDSGLLDEIYIDIEPLIFGEGIPLFSPTKNNLNLLLLDTKKIGNSGVQLHYKVIK